jgi:hypothetical protein
MFNTLPDIPDDSRNNCPVTINYITRTKKMLFLAWVRNSYLRYECKKLSFIARKDLKYDRGTREYLKGCEGNKGSFYT